MTDSVSGANANRNAVMTALKQAAAATGVDFDYLVKTAQRESNFVADAKASTSSATGLFQFTSETWLNVLERYGGKHGLAGEGASRKELLALRNDPELSARMAAELAQENAKILAGKLGRPATAQELYAAHFMGPSEAARLIVAARNGEAGAASALFPKAALANANVFRSSGGEQLTAAGLYQKLTGQTIEIADGKVTPAAMPAAASPEAAPARAADPVVLLAARLGATQLTASLMAALFEWQGEDRGR